VDALDYTLLNDFQRGFPLCPRPFAAIARQLHESEDGVLDALARLQREGKVSRVGTVFRPRTIGASTLAAMAVPEQRLPEVAALVNAHPEVNHNYSRIHEWNLWFVATAPDAAQLACALDRIEAECGHPLIRLPLIEDYHIDLGFDLAGARTAPTAGRTPRVLGPVALSATDARA
jgi:DNA-binding Lrp family transcriptional regulator